MSAARLSFALALLPGCLGAQLVQITPLGLKTGELCFADRAMILEDPTGLRILYDPGVVVAGSTDPRLGTIHVTLLSHVHQDHIGIARLNQDPNDPAAACDRSFVRIPTMPNSNLAEITARKSAAFVSTPPVTSFVGVRMGNILGAAVGVCGGDQASTAPITVPVPAPCVSPLNFGGKRTVRLAGATGEVQISVVTAKHDNTQETQLVFDPLGSELASQGLYLSSGDPAGYVITFSNGLKVYLSGDTGPTSDMSTIVRDHYRADLAIVNIGDVFTSGPEEAAFEVNSLVHPKAVIPSHVNEIATDGGKVIRSTKTARFLSLIEMAGFVPLSGRTMGFDQQAHCVVGCN
jgi:L-ascorbate metabolism protein UlaG (beta-lactamase superfamily)